VFRKRQHDKTVKRRILAVDSRSRRLGFAYFEGTALLDWGLKGTRTTLPAATVRRMLIPIAIKMMDQFRPDVLILPDTGNGAVRRSTAAAALNDAVAREAKRRDIAVFTVTDIQLKGAFVERDVALTKREIYQRLRAWHPELSSFLPRVRRFWESEAYCEPMFYAVAMYHVWRAQT
jgi:hypothetical protein